MLSNLVTKLANAKVSEENQGALGEVSRGQDRLTESSGSLSSIEMKRGFETAECEKVQNSTFFGADICNVPSML